MFSETLHGEEYTLSCIKKLDNVKTIKKIYTEMYMKNLNCLLAFLGRVLISLIFLFGALGKFMNYDVMVGYMASKELQYIPVLLYVSAFIELIGAICLIIGYKRKVAATILFLYLIPVTYFMHDFWNLSGPAQQPEMIHFLSNLAIMGGLLTIVSTHSVNCCCAEK
jgi:putative oxidoreductase